MQTTFDVRVYKTEVYHGKKHNTYYVRWRVAGRDFKEPFRLDAQADSFRSELVSAARKGEAFYVVTGLPVSMNRPMPNMAWYKAACAYVDAKWSKSAATTRRTIAEALTPATVAMLATTRGMPEPALVRKALGLWAFNTARRDDPSCPAEIRAALHWIAANTRPIASLTDGTVMQTVVDAVTSKLDGKPLAPSVASRRRKILGAMLAFASGELKVLHANPIAQVKVSATAQRASVREVDRRVVANPFQVRTILCHVREIYPQMETYFGVQYYAGLRPEEAVALNKEHLELPAAEWDEKAGKWKFLDRSGGWGLIHVTTAEPYAGKEWTDSGTARDSRHLKQRAVGETRPVQCCPDLTVLILDHLRLYGTTSDGRLFVGQRNHSELPKRSILDVWDAARRAAFTDEVYASPLAGTPYDLRHAYVSTLLNNGVAPTTVAAQAGHSVEILLRIYAKCMDGELAILRLRMREAFNYRELAA